MDIYFGRRSLVYEIEKLAINKYSSPCIQVNLSETKFKYICEHKKGNESFRRKKTKKTKNAPNDPEIILAIFLVVGDETSLTCNMHFYKKY